MTVENADARGPHVDADLRNLAGRHRVKFFQRVPQRQPDVAVAELAGQAVFVHVAEHRAKLRIGGGAGDPQFGEDATADDQVFGQRFGRVTQHVIAALDGAGIERAADLERARVIEVRRGVLRVVGVFVTGSGV